MLHREEEDLPPSGLVSSFRGQEVSSPKSSTTADQHTWKRMDHVRSAATRDKAVLLRRIEELSSDVRRLQEELRNRREDLEKYHSVFGPLHEFSASQVRLREQLVSLHDAVRHWQQKEADARAESRRLAQVIDKLKQSNSFDDSASRLADLEERLSHAYLQRKSVLEELNDVQQLVDSQVAHAKEFTEDSESMVESHLWKHRGKLAELHLQAKSKTQMIESLEKAVDDYRRNMKGKDVSQLNMRCVGCHAPQWSSPFCPATGHRHLGYCFEHAVEEALKRGEWKRLVHAATCEVSYENTKTGEIVSDLATHLQLKASREGGTMMAMNERPSGTPEIKKLLEQLHLKNDENAKLRALLKAVAKSGMVGASVGESDRHLSENRHSTAHEVEKQAPSAPASKSFHPTDALYRCTTKMISKSRRRFTD